MSQPPGSGSEGSRKIRVHLIDDEPAIIKILGRILQMAGFEVESATDGAEGLAKVKAQKPDAVVLDLMLPGMNGFDVCAAIKQDPQTSGIHVLIFTARGRHEEQRCRELGCSAFFNKLDPSSEIIAKIKQLCGS